jgi:hypothetical protein
MSICRKKDVDGRETLVLAIRQRRIALPGHDEVGGLATRPNDKPFAHIDNMLSI